MVTFSKLKKDEIGKILDTYNIGTYKSHKYLKEVFENYVYIVKTTNGKYVLKILKNINRKDYLRQLEYIDFLESKTIPVAKNIKNKKTKELIPYHGKYYVLQSFVEGLGVGFTQQEGMGPKLTIEMGKQIGKMHSILLKSKYMKDITPKFKAKNFKGIFEGDNVQNMYSELLRNLKELNNKKLRVAYIHSDLSEGNLLIKNKKLKAIIDFDDSQYHYIAYDIAIFIAHFLVSRKRIQKDRIRKFLKEYSKNFLLNNEEKKAVYFLLKYRLFGILFWYVRHLKLRPDQANSMKRGIKRNVEGVNNFEKFTLKEFLLLFPKK